MKKFLLTALLLLSAVSAWAEPLQVLVTALPQKELTERIGGSRIQVAVLVPPGADPHTFEPKPSQMRAAARARVWFTVGLPIEDAQGPRILSLTPGLKMVRVDARVKPLAMPSAVEIAGGEQAHGHEGLSDPHSWLSVRSAALEAETIRDTLSQIDPQAAPLYAANCEAFAKEAVELDRQIGEILAPCRGKAFLVFHPSWGHLARDYGLKQIPIEVQGREPGQAAMAKLITMARSAGVRAIFVQPQFSAREAEAIAHSLGIPVLPLDPLAPDWKDNLLRSARAIARGIGR